MKYILLFIIIFSFSISCNQEKQTKSINFYYWKSKFTLSLNELSIIKKLDVKKLYIRFFDVKQIDGKVQPVSILQNGDKLKKIQKSLDIIPTIYITNNSLKLYSLDTIGDLAGNINSLLSSKLNKWQLKVNEVQLDCDWTKSTQDRYFKLIEILNNKFKLLDINKLSSTIRLHQLKYKSENGIPTVNYGMLMFYNMGDLRDLKEKNSILNLKKARPYLDFLKSYPLKLDLALPLFSWGLVIRENKPMFLIHPLSNKDLDDSQFLSRDKNGYFNVLESGYLKGHYLYKGDRIRLEKIPLELLEESVRLINQERSFNNICYYYLNERVLENYELDGLKKIPDYFD